MLGFKKAERAAKKDTKDVTMNVVNSDNKQQATNSTTPAPKKKFMTREDMLASAKKLKYAKHGVGDEAMFNTKQLPEGIISKAIAQSPIDEESAKIVKEYCSNLRDGDFKDNDFFTKEDKAIYKMMKKFYDCDCGTQDYECNILDITRFINISRRAIFDRPFKDEHFCARSLKMSYFRAKTISGVNCLKFMAWAATHSYCTGLFLDARGIFDVIPKTDETLFPIWNSYINMQDDITPEVKKLFLFENGVCPYVLQKKDIFCNLHKSEGPTDDVPFADTSADVMQVPLTTYSTDRANKQMDSDYHSAMANDKDPIDPEAKATIRLNVERSEEKSIEVPVAASSTEETNNDDKYEFFSEDDNMNPGQLTFGELVANQISSGNKINPAIVASVLSNQDRVTTETLPEFIKANNKQWSNIPRLSKFTSYVKEAGKAVIYGLDAEYPGLIKAQIVNMNGDVLRELRIDPCVMYGDTLRIVTTDNAKMDIRRETFIPISNKEIVMAAINGPLTREQRKSIVDALPRCLGDFRTKYSFLDKVDMRGISAPGKEEIDGLKFEDWRALVTNISNILKDKRMPVCRMRVSEYKDPDNFQLSCDEKVLCSFPTLLLNEPSNIYAIQNKFFINATSDPTMKDQPNVYYTGPDYSAGKNKKEEVNASKAK